MSKAGVGPAARERRIVYYRLISVYQFEHVEALSHNCGAPYKQTGDLYSLVRSGDIYPQPEPEKQSCQERHITLAHLNARSIKNRNHFILIKDVILAKKFDILCVSESWLDSDRNVTANVATLM